MKNIQMLPLLAGVILVLSTSTFAAERDEALREKSVEISMVPKPAVLAAKKVLGSDPTEAKIVSGTSPLEYELAGGYDSGKPVSVHIRADGTIVKANTEGNEHEPGAR